MMTTTSEGPMQENPAQRGRFESDDDHTYHPATTTTSLTSKHEPEVVLFSCFNASATTTTSLASQRELEVVFFGCFNASTTTTSLASKCEPEVDLWGVSTLGVSFLQYQQRRGGVKPTHCPVQMFSLPFGAPGTACNFVALFTTPQ